MKPDVLSLISLEGKSALVTGGSRGIGRAISVTLAGAGASVVINYRTDSDAARVTLNMIEELGGAGSLQQFDVTDPSGVEKGVESVLDSHGAIDILVNNAGITSDGLIGRMKDADWNGVVAANLSGPFHVCRAVVRSMIRQRRGRIVNIASTAGETGNAGQVNYSASKAGLIGFTRALARELAPRNILVNAVSPGIIAGGLGDQLDEEQLEAIRTHVPLRKSGKPQDVAAAVLFLCSRMADYVTGQVIRVNGGLYV